MLVTTAVHAKLVVPATLAFLSSELASANSVDLHGDVLLRGSRRGRSRSGSGSRAGAGSEKEKEKEKAQLRTKTRGNNKSLNDLGSASGISGTLTMSASDEPLAHDQSWSGGYAHGQGGVVSTSGSISASASTSPSVAPSASASASHSASASRVSLTFKGLRSRLGGGSGGTSGARSPVSDEEKVGKGKQVSANDFFILTFMVYYIINDSFFLCSPPGHPKIKDQLPVVRLQHLY